MKKEKVINKGYTLKIVSWENDGDYYKTKFKTVETLDEAKRIYDMCTKLFCSETNGKGGVGNSMDGECQDVIIDYVKANIELFDDEYAKALKEEDEDTIFDWIRDEAYNLMGASAFYDFRVCESCSCTYSPEDIEVEVIEFK